MSKLLKSARPKIRLQLRKEAALSRSLVNLSIRSDKEKRVQEKKTALAAAKAEKKDERLQQIAKLNVPAVPRPGNASGTITGMHHTGEEGSERMRKVRAMRKFYNKQMPTLQCGTCAYSTSCPQFKAGYKCAFLPFLDSHKLNDERDLIDALKTMAEAGVRRMHLATLMETLTGGAPSLETTEALAMTFQQVAKLHEIETSANSVTATVETEDSSIIGRIFGSLSALRKETQEHAANPIVADAVVHDAPEDAALPSEQVATELIEENELIKGVKEDSEENRPKVRATITVSNIRK